MAGSCCCSFRTTHYIILRVCFVLLACLLLRPPPSIHSRCSMSTCERELSLDLLSSEALCLHSHLVLLLRSPTVKSLQGRGSPTSIPHGAQLLSTLYPSLSTDSLHQYWPGGSHTWMPTQIDNQRLPLISPWGNEARGENKRDKRERQRVQTRAQREGSPRQP